MVVAACSGGSDEGAILTVRAPAGPLTASRIEIILASADASTIVELGGQRAAPSALTEEETRYYRQRATAGTVDSVASVDGFSVRIEPNAGANADEQFIPFLIAYDRGDNGVFQVSGIGAVLDATGAPAPVVIEAGKTEAYFVDMVALTVTTGDAGIANGETMVIDCPRLDQGTYRSGMAWRPASGPQLRLLLPDRSVDGEAQDASARLLDLDCDGHEALDHDCDDLRASFHDDGVESCDGQDTNCDGARIELLECPLAPGACGPAASTGVQICDELGMREGPCEGGPQCQCAAGNPGICNKCVLSFLATADANKQAPCSPAVDTIALAACTAATPCVVEVVKRPGPWKVEISLEQEGGFGPKLVNVKDAFRLKVELAVADLPGVATTSVGEIFLAVTVNGVTTHVGIDLQLANGSTLACEVTDGLSPMACSL